MSTFPVSLSSAPVSSITGKTNKITGESMFRVKRACSENFDNSLTIATDVGWWSLSDSITTTNYVNGGPGVGARICLVER